MKSPSSESDRVLFGLRADATAADLKRAYRRAALNLHPDQNPDPAAAVRFRELTDAYRRLEPTLAPAPRRRSSQDRSVWLVAEVRNLTRRWSEAKWAEVVDGLPAAVWLASLLGVLAKLWTPSGPTPSSPAPDAIRECVTQWEAWLQHHPLASKQPRVKARPLADALDAAEARLKALSRPKRSR